MTVIKKSTIRGRFAPSPSGRMHLGNGLSALISWLDTRHLGGEMVLRMENLDPQRSKGSFAEAIMDDLKWLGLDWDEGPDIGGPYKPYDQDSRRQLYQSYLERLDAKGLIYPCYCSRSELHDASAPHASDGELIYQGTCRKRKDAGERAPALRLLVNQDPIAFIDLNHGQQFQVLPEICGDFILRRSDGVHAYQLAVTVDDGLMGINRVVRGEDLLSSTGRQIYLHQLLGFEVPTYGHVPLLVGSDGVRLSKRHLATDLGYWRSRGLAPEVLVGYLAFLCGIIEKPEALRPRDLVGEFDWQKIKKGPVVVSEEDLQL